MAILSASGPMRPRRRHSAATGAPTGPPRRPPQRDARGAFIAFVRAYPCSWGYMLAVMVAAYVVQALYR